MMPMSVSSFLGSVLLGGLFDKLGRRVMITMTFGLSAIMLFVLAYLLH